MKIKINIMNMVDIKTGAINSGLMIILVKFQSIFCK